MTYTDHATLRTATQSSHLSQRMTRLLYYFAEYNFKISTSRERKTFWPMRYLAGLNMFLLINRLPSSISYLICTVYARDDHCVALLRALERKLFTE